MSMTQAELEAQVEALKAQLKVVKAQERAARQTEFAIAYNESGQPFVRGPGIAGPAGSKVGVAALRVIAQNAQAVLAFLEAGEADGSQAMKRANAAAERKLRAAQLADEAEAAAEAGE